jgi:hypothetical protein
MDESNQDEYYRMAIDWATNFIETKEPMIDFKCYDNIVFHNSHESLSVSITRLKFSKNREQFASFIRIKKFKDWYNEQHNENKTISTR